MKKGIRTPKRENNDVRRENPSTNEGMNEAEGVSFCLAANLAD